MEKVLSPSSVALLDHAVAILRENGGDISLGLSVSQQFAAPKSDPGASSIARMKTALRNTQELRDALEAMLAVSKSIVADLSKDFIAIATQVGFDLIPDDVLAMIFEYAHDSEASPVAEILSRVDRRFRKLVLRMPMLWTYISSRRDGPSKTAVLVARSSPRMLSVLLEGRSKSWGGQSNEVEMREAAYLLESFKTAVISSSIRLGSLKFNMDIEFGEDRDRSFLKTLQTSFRDLAFPVLHTLDITYDNFSSGDGTLPDSVHFYSHWEMPSLRTLKARNFIPDFENQMPSQLVSCLVELDYNASFYQGGGWSINEATSFLGSLTNVEELEFALHYQLFAPMDVEIAFELHSLRRLSLVFGLQGITSTRNFFAAFDCPHVDSVSMDAVMPTDATPGLSICSLLTCFADAREVKDIAIKVHRELNREGPESFFDFELEEIAKRGFFNRTKNLIIEYPVSGDSNEGFFDFSKKIRSVRIEDCEGDVNRVLEMLAERTSEYEGDTEDGTCLLVNPSVLVDWQIRP